MKTKTKLELLLAMQKRRKVAQAGFTLVEVLVVAGILAILFASLVPNLLAARGRAEASAKVSEAVGLARACQAVIASGTGADTFTDPLEGERIVCNGGAVPPSITGGTTEGVFTSKPWSRDLVPEDNIKCPDATGTAITGAGSIQLTIDTTTNGISCVVA